MKDSPYPEISKGIILFILRGHVVMNIVVFKELTPRNRTSIYDHWYLKGTQSSEKKRHFLRN